MAATFRTALKANESRARAKSRTVNHARGREITNTDEMTILRALLEKSSDAELLGEMIGLTPSG